MGEGGRRGKERMERRGAKGRWRERKDERGKGEQTTEIETKTIYDSVNTWNVGLESRD